MKYYFDTFSTPVGDFSIALDERGAVVASAFGKVARLRERFHADGLVHEPQRATAVRSQVQQFFAGKRDRFEVSLAPAGTDFQNRVWKELQHIPFGQTRTYAQVAVAVGRPRAARAVARANATNPICLLVPCHRVIGADGSLTGFAFGLALKRRLLAHEQRVTENSYASVPRPGLPLERGATEG
jgi:methylated-DNA-[protein]-cysteine S-methyltransferase